MIKLFYFSVATSTRKITLSVAIALYGEEVTYVFFTFGYYIWLYSV